MLTTDRMPVIQIPCEEGTAFVLTDACVVLTSRGLFVNPRGGGNDLVPSEFRACNWHRVVNTRYSILLDAGGKAYHAAVNIRVSIYGKDLSERVLNVSSIQMKRLDFNFNAFKQLSPRISWISKYAEIIGSRRVALMMANHRRLGQQSGLSVLGNDILSLIAKLM